MKAYVCTCARNELEYIEEWVVYYIWGLGFDKAIIYDNSDDNELDFLKKKYRPFVEVIPYQKKTPQMSAFNECIDKYRYDPDVWIAFFDVDEFLVLHKHSSIQNFLSYYGQQPGVGGVVVHWFWFGNSGHMNHENEPVTCRFLHRCESKETHVFKTILRPFVTINMPITMHGASYKPGFRAVNTSMQEVRDADISEIKDLVSFPNDVAQLNHYYTKSLEEFKKKKARPNGFYAQTQIDYATTECSSEKMHSLPLEDFEKTKCPEYFANMQSWQNQVFDDSAKRVYLAAVDSKNGYYRNAALMWTLCALALAFGVAVVIAVCVLATKKMKN